MQHPTRSIVGALTRNQTSRLSAAWTTGAVSRPTAIVASASLHTARAVSEEKRGFLSRLNPFAKPTADPTPASTPAAAAPKVSTEDLSVQIDDGEAEEVVPSWKGKRQSLSPEQLEESIRSAAAPFVDSASPLHLHKISISDPKIKFQVLKACAASTGQEIPSKNLSSIQTLKDLYTTMEKLDQEARGLPDNPKGHVVAEWFEKNKVTLPPNMVFIPYQKSKGIKVEDRKSTNKRFL
ncbi:hypothetical protein BGX31_011285 [Mortierella sp. GBA43]|nr:hypothetical protein BGX31_011285 [Mortierella sp. GBA43]